MVPGGSAGTVAAIVVAACVLAGCDGRQDHSAPRTAALEAAVGAFEERGRAAGLDFVHRNGMSGRRYIAEIMAPGVGLVDYDNDGDLDVYVVQGQPLEPQAAHAGPAVHAAGGDQLYRNDLEVRSDGTRTLRFVNVTAQAGIDTRSYGMGVAAGDIDNDGWTDLYLTRLGPDVLLRNNGNGTFTDITTRAGIADAGWSVSASFFDFDRDGWLDLFVGHYIRYSLDADTGCFGPTGAPDYCNPQNYRAVPARLYRNRGNGTFADVTLAAGVARDFGPALGTLAVDVDDDGWDDLYVANDGSENQLWLNRRNGTFENTALNAGVAVSGSGRAEGSMGVDAGDYDNDGDPDLLITNLTGEGSTVYANDGSGIFTDTAASSGVRGASLPYTGFGAAWLDFDNDGWLDILAVNGAIQTIQVLAQAGDPFPLHQRKQLLRNMGNGRFEDVTAVAGEPFRSPTVGRGAAFGDIDNDGDIDAVIGNNNGPIQLLVNTVGHRRHWIGVRVVGAGGRDMPGARVAVERRDGSVRWRRARSDGSYASANDPRVLIGLGDATDVTRIRVRWPGGRVEEWPLDGGDRWVTVREGSGR